MILLNLCGTPVWQMREFNLWLKEEAINAHKGKTEIKVNSSLESDGVRLFTTTTKGNPVVENFHSGGNIDDSLRKPLTRWINQREGHILDSMVSPKSPSWMNGPTANEPDSFSYELLAFNQSCPL